jgi:hypothetical protein
MDFMAPMERWYTPARDQPWRLHVGLTVKLDVLMMITVVAFVSAIVLGAF